MPDNDGFENRPRYASLDEILVQIDGDKPAYIHLLDNQDGTFSHMHHIPCEWCDYCQAERDRYDVWEKEGLTLDEMIKRDNESPMVHAAKENPYEERDRDNE